MDSLRGRLVADALATRPRTRESPSAAAWPLSRPRRIELLIAGPGGDDLVGRRDDRLPHLCRRLAVGGLLCSSPLMKSTSSCGLPLGTAKGSAPPAAGPPLSLSRRLPSPNRTAATAAVFALPPAAMDASCSHPPSANGFTTDRPKDRF